MSPVEAAVKSTTNLYVKGATDTEPGQGSLAVEMRGGRGPLQATETNLQSEAPKHPHALSLKDVPKRRTKSTSEKNLTLK